MYDPNLSFRPQGEICFIQEIKILPHPDESGFVRMTVPPIIRLMIRTSFDFYVY